jgi:hypothetical protein
VLRRTGTHSNALLVHNCGTGSKSQQHVDEIDGWFALVGLDDGVMAYSKQRIGRQRLAPYLRRGQSK